MTLIVNLSTTHDNSVNKSLSAFIQLCNEHSRGCLQCTPSFFQQWTNSAWVMAKFKANYATLIEPYKLGKLTTAEFLEGVSRIFYFMQDMNKEERHALFIEAWNASIGMSAVTENRLHEIMERAKLEPVYLISNTNELNAQAVLALYKHYYPLAPFKPVDVSIKESKAPVELLPNVYLCLSYRYGAFKGVGSSTTSLLDYLATHCLKGATVVSQYEGDLKRAKELGLEVESVDDFYTMERSTQMNNNA